MTSEEIKSALQKLIYQTKGKKAGEEIVLAFDYADNKTGASYINGDKKVIAKLIIATLNKYSDLRKMVVLGLLDHKEE